MQIPYILRIECMSGDKLLTVTMADHLTYLANLPESHKWPLHAQGEWLSWKSTLFSSIDLNSEKEVDIAKIRKCTLNYVHHNCVIMYTHFQHFKLSARNCNRIEQF